MSVNLPVRSAASVLIILSLTACGGLLKTDYERGPLQIPAQWEHGKEPYVASSFLGGAWWKNFGDPELNALVDAVLLRNNDLAVAAIRVRRAQLQAGLADDAFVPALGGEAKWGRSRALRGERDISTTQSLQLNASYELDLWGKLARQSDAAHWEAQATEQDRRSAALSLVGTTATLYWQMGYINQRLQSSLESIAYAKKTAELVKTQYQAGAVSALEEAEARQSLTSQQAAHALLVQQRIEYVNALAILFDGPPGAVVADPKKLPQAVLPVPRAGVPAELLARRPDLQAAEARLKEALANVDATRLSYYPPLRLTGSAGGVSDALSTLLQNPVASLGAGLTLPFLQWTQRQLDIKISKAEYEERVVQFRQTLYQAMADVENALSARVQYAEQGVFLQQSLDAARVAEQLYEVRYHSGAVALRFWLDAQEKRRAAEVTRDENHLNQLLNQVKVYQALGGDDA